ncbi:sensor domain-containing diguanylate cyclase [Catellatospora paridis]|uniref:sensor domain-containing diguanylate cyclase n=1 Tax=Catellatospora paridis TaxID=1617086 RepID=UPI0012D3B1BD|nr:sensor domain-containing diguanylate cyclase [Catellatospora paridis]
MATPLPDPGGLADRPGIAWSAWTSAFPAMTSEVGADPPRTAAPELPAAAEPMSASAQAQRRRRLDPFLAALGGTGLLSVIAVLGDVVPGRVADVACTAAWLVFAGQCRRVATAPHAARAVRVYWRMIGAAGLLFALAHLLYAFGRPRGTPSEDPIRLAAMALIAAAVATLGWAVVTYPMQAPRHDRRRLLLDVATVMTALTMFAWLLWLPDGSPDGSPVQQGLSLLACLLALLGVTAGVKLRLSGSAPWIPPAGVFVCLGVLVGSWSLANLVSLGPNEIKLVQAGQLAAALLFALGARVQWTRMRVVPAGLSMRRRAVNSPLPYLAIAASLTMLVTVLVYEGLTVRGWGMVVGVVAIAGLAMVRQSLAFGENSRLLRRLRTAIRDLHQQERRFRSLVQNASDLTLLLDPDSTVRYASPALHDLLGLDPPQAVGRRLTALAPDAAAAIEQLLADVQAQPRSAHRAQLCVAADPGPRWLEALATNRMDDPGVGGVIVNVHDVTDSRRLEERLREQAMHDELTGLPNRFLLNERIQTMQDGTGTSGRHDAVLMLDLDDFKSVNDQLGHQTGDGLLVVVAQRLRRSVRPVDIAARVGGDEFVVLLSDTTRDGAVATAQRIHAALSEPMTVGEHQLSVGASIGVALGSVDRFDDLLRDADTAMYTAKRDPDGVRVHVVD